MIAIVHSIYSQSVHAPALDAGLMDNNAERYVSSTSIQNFMKIYRRKLWEIPDFICS